MVYMYQLEDGLTEETTKQDPGILFTKKPLSKYKDPYILTVKGWRRYAKLTPTPKESYSSYSNFIKSRPQDKKLSRIKRGITLG